MEQREDVEFIEVEARVSGEGVAWCSSETNLSESAQLNLLIIRDREHGWQRMSIKMNSFPEGKSSYG